MPLDRVSCTVADISPTTVALVAGILSNTLLKLVVALVVGRGLFRVATTLALATMAVVMGLMLSVG